MMQVFFLSILFNVIAGLVLLKTKGDAASKETLDDTKIEDKSKKTKFLDNVNKTLSGNEFLGNKTFVLVIGILTLLTGVLKLFCVAKGGLLILGDLFPSIAGISAGFAILLNYYLSSSTTENNLPRFLQVVFIDNIYWVGIAAIAVAFLHFIMPGVLFF